MNIPFRDSQMRIRCERMGEEKNYMSFTNFIFFFGLCNYFVNLNNEVSKVII